PPVAQFLDPRVDQPGRRLALRRLALLHACFSSVTLFLRDALRESAATTASTAAIPDKCAPCAVAKLSSEVASPAKNSRSWSGGMSAGRASPCPGGAKA